jgi:predicted flap endonuclease-1-like 5' DNA nuclease
MSNKQNELIDLSSGIQHGIIGHIKGFAGGRPPEDWALCDGSEHSIDAYPALFATIGARYGGDGVRTFCLPDLTAAGRFIICCDGYFALEGAPPAGWGLASENQAYIQRRARALQESHAQRHDPATAHKHVSALDPEWLEQQAQVLKDGYEQGRDPLHRHQHVSELDPEWLERQAQVLKDGYAQGHDPLVRHVHVSELDPEWLERQSQVLEDAYVRGHDPHHRHPNAADIQDELDQRAQEMIAAYARGEDPLATPPDGTPTPDDLEQIEGIGPKTAARLQAAGITTFSQLAGTDVSDLSAILDAAGNWPADPGTWPEQAALATADQWDELADLQKALKGGRRVG